MVVKRKPVNVDEFIEGGGLPPLVPVSNKSEVLEEEIKGLKLRLPIHLLSEVDAAVKLRRPIPSRHQWILEAICEKLLREAGHTETAPKTVTI